MIDDAQIQHAKAHPMFRKLARERTFLGLGLFGIIFMAYFSYILTIAFSPQSLGARIGDDTVVTFGVVVGLALIILGLVLTAIYVAVANIRFDALAQRIEEELR